MLNLDGCIPCPEWCLHLYCANEVPIEERWHRSNIWSVSNHLAHRLPGTGAIQVARIYLSQGDREVEATINVDRGYEPLLRLRPDEARQFARHLQFLLVHLGGG